MVSPIFSEAYQGYKITVFLSPDVSGSFITDEIILHTTDKKYPRVEIPVTASIVGDTELFPSMLFFGFVKQGETPSTKVTISTTGISPLKIERIENPLPFISTNLTQIKEGKEYELMATLEKNTPAGVIKGTITIYTNDLDQPEIEIPVYALVEKGIVDEETL
jgi:hypothetical protein